MTLDVIGVGLGRTGTLSLKHALERLLSTPCYHMVETLRHPEHDALWLRALEGETSVFDAIFDGYRAVVAWPAVTFWRELLDTYPQAKAVLTVRDPEAWVRSMTGTVLPVLTSPVDPDGSVSAEHRRMTRRAVLERSFAGRYVERRDLLAFYARHEGEVRRTVPPERLLVYDVKEGWEPLCAFLELPRPADPFPHRNTTAEFLGTHRASPETG